MRDLREALPYWLVHLQEFIGLRLLIGE